MARTIQISGIDVGELYFAENGKEGLDQLEVSWPDIVFCDINMPVMNGIEFVEKLQESDEWKDLPVVIVSTEGSSTRMDELRERGIRGYIRKPFTAEQVAEMIEKVLGANEHA
jgi:two-component system chemotaxis response regulator CheY